MADEIQISGKNYISSKRAAEFVGYAQDYVGQLAREGHIDAQRVGGLWYVNPESIQEHKKKADAYVPTPPQKHTPQELKSIIMLDGREYISAGRAGEITGYHRDYVGQLARGKVISSLQIGNRWYVDRKALEAHKEEKDALLAAVQTESVGLRKSQETPKNEPGVHDNREIYFRYISHVGQPLLPNIPERLNATEKYEVEKEEEPIENKIPIHVNAMPIKKGASVTEYKNLKMQKMTSVRTSGITRKYASFTIGILVFVAVVSIGAYIFSSEQLGGLFLSKESDIIKTSGGAVTTRVVNAIAGVANGFDGFAEIFEKYFLPELEYRSN